MPEHDAWDDQIKRDLQAGRLDPLLRSVHQALRRSTLKRMPDWLSPHTTHVLLDHTYMLNDGEPLSESIEFSKYSHYGTYYYVIDVEMSHIYGRVEEVGGTFERSAYIDHSPSDHSLRQLLDDLDDAAEAHFDCHMPS